MNCEYCGKLITGRKRRYCDRECSRLADARSKENPVIVKTCLVCKQPFLTSNSIKVYCSYKCCAKRNNKGQQVKICAQCGKEFITHKIAGNRQKCCSRRCGKLWGRTHGKGTTRICQHCGREFISYRKDVYQYCSRACSDSAKRQQGEPARQLKALRQQRVCRVCGKQYRSNNEVFCSNECRKEYYRQQALLYEKRNYKPKRIICAECGKEYITQYGDMKRKFCSTYCGKQYSRRVAKAKRRARQRGLSYASIDPISIFNRDNWTCQLCGIHTPRIYRGTIEDDAPELDHIIPLARGGAHTERNVQCLCRKCNCIKGATLPIGVCPSNR